jgi:hypothetical protein
MKKSRIWTLAMALAASLGEYPSAGDRGVRDVLYAEETDLGRDEGRNSLQVEGEGARPFRPHADGPRPG